MLKATLKRVAFSNLNVYAVFLEYRQFVCYSEAYKNVAKIGK